MAAVGIIPARFGSTRFPGKVLTPIAGRPMIQHVWDGARRASSLRAVLIATDDERVAKVCREFGAEAVLTSPDHPTGTDRLAEVAAGLSDDIVVNVQGDEPLIEGFVIDAAVRALEAAPEAPMATVIHRAETAALSDPNRVKVVVDRRGRALYFSRAAIPHTRSGAAPAPWQHVGLYAYRREFLAEYVKLPPTPLEQAEALEQLRALEHGHAIQTAVVEGWESRAVDVPADVAGVESTLAVRADARG